MNHTPLTGRAFAKEIGAIFKSTSAKNQKGIEELFKDIGIENFNIITTETDIKSIFDLTEEEKRTLMNTYAGTITANISKNKYYKQTNTLITMENGDVQTNAYGIKTTIEECYFIVYIFAIIRFFS